MVVGLVLRVRDGGVGGKRLGWVAWWCWEWMGGWVMWWRVGGMVVCLGGGDGGGWVDGGWGCGGGIRWGCGCEVAGEGWCLGYH